MKSAYHQYIANKYPEHYQKLLQIEEANAAAMQKPKDEIILRLESIGFHRGAVNALSDTHYLSTPCDKKGDFNLIYQRGGNVYNDFGDLGFSYKKGVDVWKSCGQILKEGFYTLDEFNLVLDRMEGSRWYRSKGEGVRKLPVLTNLQRKVYIALPSIFSWAEGKDIAIQTGMPSRTAQRFFGNGALFDKVKNGFYMKKIIFEEM